MNRIILFDGNCHFCDRSVQFIIKHDPKALYKFASLQSEIGIAIRKKYDVPDGIDSIVLIENEHYFLKSTAALRICRNLTGFWKVFSIFHCIPIPIRDSFYEIIARKRYSWFGRKDHCELPSPDIRKRFL